MNEQAVNNVAGNGDSTAVEPKVFILHVAKDRPFVELVYHLLKYHGLQPWHSNTEFESLTTSDDPQVLIKHALTHSDYLLVALSDNSAQYLDITPEITLFEELHQPNRPIFCLLLEQLENIANSSLLLRHSYIDFTQSMVTGFEQLLASLGKSFLDHADLIANPQFQAEDRRKSADRRGSDRRQVDRRKDSASERPRKGFWKYYAIDTAATIDSRSCFEMESRYRAFGILLEEASRYHFYSLSDGKEIEPETALSNCFHAVWQHLSQLDSILDHHFIAAVAEQMCHSYLVKARDRRYPIDRRRQKERRSHE